MIIQQVLLLLLLWMCLPHSCYSEMLFRRTTDHHPKGFVARLSGSDGKALHRQKRGWMWNQFFLLEEYTGSDYQYVGKLHSDQDKGDGSLKYILSGDGAGTLFIIDEKTGDIHATRRIDREEKAFYTLRAQAINRRTLRPVEPESEFVIKIHDINDNEPTFPEEIYTASVPEMSVVDTIHLRIPESSPVGTAIGSVKATDADTGKNAEMEYRIVDGDGTDMFDIVTQKDTQEGIITVHKPLDYETRRLYTLKIEAENTHVDPRFYYLGPFKDTTIVKISVEDVDEPPVFSRSSYLFEVHEDIEMGTIIGTVMARDPDSASSPIRFSLDRHTDLDRIFNIHSGNGSIYTSKPLDREISQWHNLSVIAAEINNPKDTTRVSVYVRILDVNDNAPQFAVFYDTFVCENARAGQLIQTISAVDKDDPLGGQKFFFSLAAVNPNFTVQDNEDNTARILTRRNGFSRHEISTYFLPVVISDNDYPIQSSTGTLTIRVCTCDNRGNMQSCNAEALLLPAGLSTGALIAILLCIIILLVIVVLFAALKRQRKKEPLILSKEDIRDNIVSYNDEGGGEEDTQAFDIGTLRNPAAIEDKKLRRDIIPETLFIPRRTPSAPNNTDVRDFINQRLKEHDTDPSAPPYDSLATYAYEGNDSIAESLSSLESGTTEGDQNYDYLREWGPRFNKLAEMYGGGESDKDTS
ncbi:cadherin-10 isoform 3-T3 [Pangshura tecta]